MILLFILAILIVCGLAQLSMSAPEVFGTLVGGILATGLFTLLLLAH